jgi:HSP20 family protein
MTPKRSLIPMGFGQSFDPFRDFQRLEKTFSDFWKSMPLVSWAKEGILWPNIDVTENDEAIEVTVDLPGLEEKDIHLEINNGILNIRGEKKEEREEGGGNYYISERLSGCFNRSIEIPTEVDENKVEATLKDGVLKVVLPKSAEGNQRRKQIGIKRQ